MSIERTFVGPILSETREGKEENVPLRKSTHVPRASNTSDNKLCVIKVSPRFVYPDFLYPWRTREGFKIFPLAIYSFKRDSKVTYFVISGTGVASKMIFGKRVGIMCSSALPGKNYIYRHILHIIIYKMSIIVYNFT